ncbi:N/A [soil metagenome]
MKIMNFNTFCFLFREAFKKWWKRDPFSQSAIIGYSAIFSLPGLLVVIVTSTGYFFGADAISGRLHKQIAETLGADTADQIQNMIISVHEGKGSLWANCIALTTILIGAAGVFVQLQKSLDAIWEVKASPSRSGIKAFLKTRIFSFGLIISIAFLLLISLAVSTIITALGTWIQHRWSTSLLVIFQFVNFIFSIGIITTLFALMFKILPDVKIKAKLVWGGAFVTAVLFEIGKFILGFYFGHANPESGYGVAGSVILILLWTAYSSMIVFLGAELTKVYSDHYYGEVTDSENEIKQQEVTIETPASEITELNLKKH